MGADLDHIVRSMEHCGSWEERCRLLINLGRTLPALPAEDQTEENRVPGCLSKVWVKAQPGPESPPPGRFARPPAGSCAQLAPPLSERNTKLGLPGAFDRSPDGALT